MLGATSALAQASGRPRVILGGGVDLRREPMMRLAMLGVEWRSDSAWLGARLEGMYGARGRELATGPVPPVVPCLPDAPCPSPRKSSWETRIGGAMASVVLAPRVSRAPYPYVVAGAGLFDVRVRTRTSVTFECGNVQGCTPHEVGTDDRDARWRGAPVLGAGLAIPIGRVPMTIEARYIGVDGGRTRGERALGALSLGLRI